MSRLHFVTAGESHGEHLIAVLTGLPSGLKIDLEKINHEMRRRQGGFGRGGRMMIEKDSVVIAGGLWRSKTTGAPLSFLLTNRDHKIDLMPDLTAPRPGHADLAGVLKFDQPIRPILERASARETAMRVAVGSAARELLKALGIDILSHVIQIGSVTADVCGLSYEKIKSSKQRSDLNCASAGSEKKMMREIARAMAAGNSLGGVFEVRAKGVPPGLGSCMEAHLKLNARLAGAFMGMQSVKAVGIGLGKEAAGLKGTEMHDAVRYSLKKGFFHPTNHAGGIEGGMSNGEEIIVQAAMKPIATLKRPLSSVSLKTRQSVKASVERSDTCAVPAGSVVGEAIMSYEIADALLEKTGGDSLQEVKRNLEGYLKQIAKFRL